MEKEDQPSIQCEVCHNTFYAGDIHCLPKPLLFGDHFLHYRCSACTTNSAEQYVRDNMSWVAVVHLVIYNLIRRQNIMDRDKPDEEKRHKYFRWKDDICTFIDDYWDYLVPGKKRSPTWHNTIASVLSTHGAIFKSGYEKFHQSAWWTLHDEESPPGKESKPKASKPKPAQKRSRRDSRSEKPKKQKTEPPKAQSAALPPPPPTNQIKEEDEMFDLGSVSDLSSDPGILSDDGEVLEKHYPHHQQSSSTAAASACPPSPVDNVAAQKESDDHTHPLIFEDVTVKKEQEQDASNLAMPASPPTELPNNDSAPAVKVEEEQALLQINTSTYTQQPQPQQPQQQRSHPHVPTFLTQQMEWQMLERLRNSSKKLPAAAVRYERKLAVRRLKRSLGLKLFDVDSLVTKQLRSRAELVPIATTSKQTHSLPPNITATDAERVDLLPPESAPSTAAAATGSEGQTPPLSSAESNITYTPYNCSFASRLYGPIRPERIVTKDEPWLSPWNGRKLRPYIRRDFESVTPRMTLMQQIKARNPEAGPEEQHSIDYVYFQPQHLTQVNTMLRRCFWDGVDVSESLLFPEFSVVALYKRLVVGCAFMTPEAYVTYIAVLPEWDNAGIGQFMLYHLFQTAISKDITLHVSANNTAMILYQKFGFKPEEFIVDFYDKYLPSDSSYSKNAFFLRLRR